MRIYDYLFYKLYLLGQRTNYKKNEDAIEMASFGILFCILIFIIAIVLFVLDLIESDFIEFRGAKLLFVVIAIMGAHIALRAYYSHNQRYKRIIARCETFEQKYNVHLHPILVLILYVIISLGFLWLLNL